ncbi:unnamed protein product [Caenorhabditis nigoni]
MNKHTPYNLVDENVDIGDGQLQEKNGRKTAKKVQKRSRKSDRSQDVDSKKMKKSESPVQIYKVQTRIFKDFFKNVLPHVGLEQPNWENMNSARLVKFLEKFDAAATNFKIKKPRSILTAARCRKVHLDSDSFKEGHLATVLARMLSIADERVLKKHYKSFSSETYGATRTGKLREILYPCAPGTHIVVTKLIDKTRFHKRTYLGHFNSFSHTGTLDSIDRPMEWSDKSFKFRVVKMDSDKVCLFLKNIRLAEVRFIDETRNLKNRTSQLSKNCQLLIRYFHDTECSQRDESFPEDPHHKAMKEGKDERHQESRRAGEFEKESCSTLADYDVPCYQ